MTHAQRDIVFVIASVFLAVALSKSGALHAIFSYTEDAIWIGSLISGVLFTSVLTTPLSIAAIAEIAGHAPVWLVASIGGLGALLGDLILFSLFRGHVANDIAFLTRSHKFDRLKNIFHLKIFRWTIPLFGALIIASPLPDELGLAMMGLAKTRLAVFIPISFLMNMLGITLIYLVANSL